MNRLKIYSRDGETVRYEAGTYQYSGKFMGDRAVTLTVKSPVRIYWEIGDYLMLRGEKFMLYSVPCGKKQSRRDENGAGLVYDNITFHNAMYGLSLIKFKDYVLGDNNKHYGGLGVFSFYMTRINDLGDRVLANISRVYGSGGWQILYADKYDVTDADGNVIVKHSDVVINSASVSVTDDMDVLSALNLYNSMFNLNYIHLVIDGVNTIIVGGKAVIGCVDFEYGKGRGLLSIEQTRNDGDAIITRLHAYGSTRNIPYRYYNKKYNDIISYPWFFKDDEYQLKTMYINKLMLPYEIWKKDAEVYDAYIEKNVDKYGIREADVTFDGSNEEAEIYPSMECFKANDVKEGMIGYKNYSGPWTWYGLFNDFMCQYMPWFNYERFLLPNFEDARYHKYLYYFIVGSDEWILPDYKDFDEGNVTYVDDHWVLTEQVIEPDPMRAYLNCLGRTEEDYRIISNGMFFILNRWKLSGEDKYKEHKDGTIIPYRITHSEVWRLGEDTWGDRGPYDILLNYKNVNGYNYFEYYINKCIEYIQDVKREHLLEIMTFEKGHQFYFYGFPERLVMMGYGWSEEYSRSIIDSVMELEKKRLVSAYKMNGLKGNMTGISDCGVSINGDYSEGSVDINGVKIAQTFKVNTGNLFFDVKAFINANETPMLSMKSGKCGGRSFEIINSTIEGELTLKRDDSDVGGLNMVFPNTSYTIDEGDEFILTGIDMPDLYVEAAERRLGEKAEEYISRYDKETYNYVPVIDNQYMQRHPEIACRMMEGMMFPFNDTDEGDTEGSAGDLGVGHNEIPISMLTIKYNEGYLPRYDVQLEDNVKSVTIKQLVNSEVKSVATTVVIENEHVETKLSRTDPDTAQGRIRFSDGLLLGDNYVMSKEGDVRVRSIGMSEGIVSNGEMVSGTHFFLRQGNYTLPVTSLYDGVEVLVTVQSASVVVSAAIIDVDDSNVQEKIVMDNGTEVTSVTSTKYGTIRLLSNGGKWHVTYNGI